MDKGAWKATVHGVTDTTEQLHFLSLYHYASPTAIYEFPGSSVVKNLPASSGDARDVGLIPVSGRSPGVGNGNHSSILAWKIPWTEEPGGLQSLAAFIIVSIFYFNPSNSCVVVSYCGFNLHFSNR